MNQCFLNLLDEPDILLGTEGRVMNLEVTIPILLELMFLCEEV